MQSLAYLAKAFFTFDILYAKVERLCQNALFRFVRRDSVPGDMQEVRCIPVELDHKGLTMTV